MVRRHYGKWSVNDLEKAIAEYKSGKITFNKCCLTYNIPKPTFIRHIDGEIKKDETERDEQPKENQETNLKRPRRKENLIDDYLLFLSCPMSL